MAIVYMKPTDEIINRETGEVVSPNGLEQWLLSKLEGLSKYQAYYLLNELVNGLGKLRDRVKKQIKDELEPGRWIDDNEIIIGLHIRRQKRLDTQELKRQAPDIYKRFQKEIEQEVLIVKKKEPRIKIHTHQASEALEDLPI